MILRMHPSPDLVFEGQEPAGYKGEVVKKEDWGLGLGLDDFFRLRKFGPALSWLLDYIHALRSRLCDEHGSPIFMLPMTYSGNRSLELL
jgi:hypothetical protein